ncbi:type IV pilin protein [Pseudomonas nicosulfuronedens]|uniref:Type IV pilin protein n=1 Tax=Pseudomonas nicosulfuronedens TaxID=2571105 RepID=A0A5R9QZ47_9PSED|nr:type IV pilin protein [Pseudomonas nicosulfuronedens]MDH1008505.1 type IV pilin protein [Pseudomonas nicosulfuronedens]MDH1982698.1 type IV pilin protein [Pseudomonas nicosulfuronedens]MDH2030555.1 type IV pilin protein [Pseudomonas nicosulfuronedens]TLX75540.1 type IV pilin protein [Pseudomonas nicosulfuronedens]
MKSMHERAGGFTLVELLVCLSLIGILLGIALPAYQEHIQRVRRVEAQKSLVELAQSLERFYTSRGTYVGATLPFEQSPREAGKAFYRLGFASGPDELGYVLQAEPVGAMAGDICGPLTLASSGLRGSATERCW